MKTKAAAKATKGQSPVEIKRGGVVIKIKPGRNIVAGVVYPQWTVHHRGRRQRFASLAAATQAAELIAVKAANEDTKVLDYSSQDWSRYTEANQMLAPLGVPLNLAVNQFVAAVRLLPQGVTVGDAAAFWVKRHPASLVPMTVEAAKDEFVALKRNAGLSEVHLSDLETRLGRFAKDVGMPIGGVSGTLVQKWLDGLAKLGPRSKRNYQIAVCSFFRWAVSRKYVGRETLEEIEAVQLPKQLATEIEIFTPSEMTEILNCARPELTAWLAIGAFAGLRSAEIARLDWSEVDFAEGHLVVAAGKSKTGSRRVVPLLGNLAAWLQPHRKDKGPVNAFVSWWNEIASIPAAVNAARRQAAIEAGKGPTDAKEFAWKRNALRHSFCSYRLSIIKDVPRLSYEAGNSPAMIHQHYKSLVPESQALAWFNVVPAIKTNVIPLLKEIA